MLTPRSLFGAFSGGASTRRPYDDPPGFIDSTKNVQRRL